MNVLIFEIQHARNRSPSGWPGTFYLPQLDPTWLIYVLIPVNSVVTKSVRFNLCHSW